MSAPPAAGPTDAVFRALADPTRRALVERLAAADASVTELADPLPMSLNAVSKHLKVLEDAGLVARERRGRTHRLRLRPDALTAAEAWVRSQTRTWEARLDALARVLDPEDPA